MDYSLDNRDADKEILPLAQELKMGVLTTFRSVGAVAACSAGSGHGPPTGRKPSMRRAGRTFLVVLIRPSPPRSGTTKADNMKDNQGAGKGKLPTAAQRAQIEKFWDSW